MLKIGCHLSAAKGYTAMGRDALSIHANTFQFFTRNPRGGRARKLNLDDESKFILLMKENSMGPIVAHAPYTMNVCSANEKVRAFGLSVLKDDLMRMERLPGNYYNFHPGSHTGQGADEGIRLIADALNGVLPEIKNTTVLLETMAGKGTEVGRSFEQLRQIMDRVECSQKIGVCLDTCHVFDAGYDIVGNSDGVLEEFDRIIGLSKLRAIHLNDSKNSIGSHKDRHELIGQGQIGFDALLRFAHHPAIRNLPFILETRTDWAGHAKEIEKISAAWKF